MRRKAKFLPSNRFRSTSTKKIRWRWPRNEWRTKQNGASHFCKALSLILRKRLPLGELEAAARFGTALFLALDPARIARKEAACLQSGTQIGLKGDERLGDAMAPRPRLP